jgi:ABC-type transport system substrate-binding protein
MLRSDATSHPRASQAAKRRTRRDLNLAGAALALTLVVTASPASFGKSPLNNGSAETTPPQRAGKAAQPSGNMAGAARAEEDGAAVSTSRPKVRDPFVVPSRVKREPKVPVKREPRPVPAPGIESRLTAYRDLVRASSASSALPAPDKLSPYLVEELTVTGIFRDSGGYGAFVAADPTKLTFFVRPGMRTHDGVVREILPTGIKFSRATRYDDGTVRQTEEFRALRKEKSGTAR